MSAVQKGTAAVAAPSFTGDLSHIEFKTEYRSLKEEPATLFYKPCLLNSTLYKRAVGYFKSSVYLVVGAAVVEFARRGGRIQLICSPELDDDDIDGIAAGYARRSELIEKKLVESIDHLLSQLETSYQTQILATLISAGAMDIKLALRSDRKGLYHEKIGIFRDGIGNAVSFKGSANETWSGWHLHGNFESIEVFCGWRGGLELVRVRKHEEHFDSLWSGDDPDVEVFPFPNGAVEHFKKAALKGLDAVEDRTALLKPAQRSPLPHQAAALDAWAASGKRGIFKHATGSGKTFTAILAIRDQVAANRPALVLVPSKLLLAQWAKELREEIPGATLLVAGGGRTTWKVPGRLTGMTQDNPTLGGRIVLATMPTASSDQFRRNVSEGDHLLLVADEVHQLGSSENSRLLQVASGSRLGLSATPERYGDPEGTTKLFAFFGGIIPPLITLADAVKAGRLVPYEYHPRTVTLTATEAESWKKVTDDISFEIARQKKDKSGRKPLTERAKLLLIQRSRIAKKAAQKVRLAGEIITREFQAGQHWLVYCEDSEHLSQVMQTLKDRGLSPIEYHSGMSGDRDATMAWFLTFGGILVSIKCLDEGVDIPKVSHALILASSQNPRQFIQRRGRVLRAAAGKTLAVIFDAIVVPVHVDDEPEQAALLQSELVRSIEFASSAINKGAATELMMIAANAGLEVDSLSQVGIEEDEDE